MDPTNPKLSWIPRIPKHHGFRELPYAPDIEGCWIYCSMTPWYWNWKTRNIWIQPKFLWWKFCALVPKLVKSTNVTNLNIRVPFSQVLRNLLLPGHFLQPCRWAISNFYDKFSICSHSAYCLWHGGAYHGGLIGKKRVGMRLWWLWLCHYFLGCTCSVACR
jgi:hypothetical protein